MKNYIYLISIFISVIFCTCQERPQSETENQYKLYKVQVENTKLSLSTSDSLLAESFKWAVNQAMGYVHDGSDPVGLWYEAALPKREAFCMRDVAHQSTGAHLLGLAAHNKNMLRKFAENISESKDWCTYWEINRYDLPAPVDYRNDHEFWYNLPANYDVVDACYRQFLWTGDEDYILDSIFQNFYERSMVDYTAKWQLSLSEVMHRNRWVNTPQPLDSNDYFHICRGLPSYEEGNPFQMQVGADLFGFQYKAFSAWANMLEIDRKPSKAKNQWHKAEQVKNYFLNNWWNDSTQSFYLAKFKDKGFVQRPSPFLLYTGIAHSEEKYRSEVETLINFKKTNIESQSYFPLIFYRYDQNKEAYRHLLDLSHPNKNRREYPEVSYAVVEAMVCGLAGIEADASKKQVHSLGRSFGQTDVFFLSHIPVFNGEISIRHEGAQASELYNETGEVIRWKAKFYGKHKYLRVNGKKIRGLQEKTLSGNIVSFVEFKIEDKSKVKVEVM